mmetsp:Transcript_108770/g.347162  ORF Transcript_108770/g.347162 Transcript_108770/m.347162 type:complete len:268 (-) Transcript_108770:520-1323(-)
MALGVGLAASMARIVSKAPCSKVATAVATASDKGVCPTKSGKSALAECRTSNRATSATPSRPALAPQTWSNVRPLPSTCSKAKASTTPSSRSDRSVLNATASPLAAAVLKRADNSPRAAAQGAIPTSLHNSVPADQGPKRLTSSDFSTQVLMSTPRHLHSRRNSATDFCSQSTPATTGAARGTSAPELELGGLTPAQTKAWIMSPFSTQELTSTRCTRQTLRSSATDMASKFADEAPVEAAKSTAADTDPAATPNVPPPLPLKLRGS